MHILLGLLFLIFTNGVFAETEQAGSFQYKARKFDYLIGMDGLSDDLLKDHFELYKGYVTQTNLLNQKLKALLNAPKMSAADYSAIKKAYAFEYNGMKLHELYFGNLSKDITTNEDLKITQKLANDFGGIDLWEKDFVQTALTRGIGWVICFYDQTSKSIINSWISSHEVGVPIYDHILIIMDCWEHAYLKNYGIKRIDYMNTMMKHIDWDVVEKRYQSIK